MGALLPSPLHFQAGCSAGRGLQMEVPCNLLQHWSDTDGNSHFDAKSRYERVLLRLILGLVRANDGKS